MISLTLNKDIEALRKEFTLWLKDNPPPEVEGKIELQEFVEISTLWQKTLAKDRWVGVHWPEQYGGRGLTVVEEAVLQECLAEVRAPQLINLFGLTMVGPVLIQHGTDEQKQRFLQKILDAEEIWCQGFSEPDAGSDLASVATSGVKDKDHWVLNGQKVWTSFAQYADWCFALVRTDSETSKYKGLSYLLVPMSTEGIQARPLTQISGDEEFNELFFEDVRVPDTHMVGSPGDGWKIAISTLMYERVILTFARHLQSEEALSEIRDYLKERGYGAAELQQFGALNAKSMALRALALSHLVEYDKKPPGPEGSLDKLSWSETFQEICSFALSLQGSEGVVTDGAHAHREGQWQHRYLYSRGRTIAAGTSEIQRNIIAERLLGLPRFGKS